MLLKLRNSVCNQQGKEFAEIHSRFYLKDIRAAVMEALVLFLCKKPIITGVFQKMIALDFAAIALLVLAFVDIIIWQTSAVLRSGLEFSVGSYLL